MAGRRLTTTAATHSGGFAGRETRRRWRADEGGVVGIVAFVLIFALAITLYGYAAQNDVPRWGVEAEGLWDDQIQATLGALARAASSEVASGASAVGVVLPAPPDPRSLDVPLIGKREPLRPTGATRFDPTCASFSATHVSAGGAPIDDLVGGARGCLVFEAHPAYGAPFAYRVEHGGLLRIQEGRALVFVGPSLDLNASGLDGSGLPVHAVTLSLPGLRGTGVSVSNDRSSVAVDLVPSLVAAESPTAPDAVAATWRIESEYAEAWKTWFDERLELAGIGASAVTSVCAPPDASCPSRPAMSVTFVGPESGALRNDVALAITYGSYTVTLR